MEQSRGVRPTAGGLPDRTGAAGRIGNVIVDPVAAFRDIGASPTWALAFVTIVALRFVSLIAFYRPDVSPVRLVAGVLFQVITVAPAVIVSGLVLWMAASVWRAGLSWPAAFSVAVHVHVAYTLATVLVASAAGALLPPSVELDLRNPPFTNLEPLARADAPVARRLLWAADVRMAYAFALTYVGVSAATASADGRRGIRSARIVATCVGTYLAAAMAPVLIRG